MAKKAIEVQSRQEGEDVANGLKDPVVRAFARIMGILENLNPSARLRTLKFVNETVKDIQEEGVVQAR